MNARAGAIRRRCPHPDCGGNLLAFQDDPREPPELRCLLCARTPPDPFIERLALVPEEHCPR